MIPLSRGGTDDRANLVPACKPCNMDKLDFTPEEWRAWREEEGLRWPPLTRFATLMEILQETKKRYPDVQVSQIRVFSLSEMRDA